MSNPLRDNAIMVTNKMMKGLLIAALFTITSTVIAARPRHCYFAPAKSRVMVETTPKKVETIVVKKGPKTIIVKKINGKLFSKKIVKHR